mmetsp:Transcript_32993/g.83750  ORF Transcript_32993/g.83750 Transcript_32993/m.83750 type:complete len:288 (-) Transcript_32993:164-1027(-)
MELSDLEQGLRSVGSGGHVLNVQELTCLQCGLSILKAQDKYNSIFFWGKVFGQSSDYYVAYGLKDPEFEFPAKTFYYAGEDFEFKPMPKLNQDQAAKVLQLGIEKPFGGAAGKSIEAAVEGEEEVPPADDADPEVEGASQKPKKLTEADRLAQVVQEIDFDTAVVPKGAHALSENHTIVSSTDFKGLGATEATALNKYVHFRPPVSIAALRALARSDAEFYANFLDPLEADLPKGCWAVRQDPSASLVTLRSLCWPGYIAYHIPGTTKYGGMYFGYAQKSKDLPFML